MYVNNGIRNKAPGMDALNAWGQVFRVGQNHISAPYMTVCMVISLPKIPYVQTVYERMYGDFPCYKYRTYTVYDLIFGDFPATNTVCTHRI